MQHKTVRKSLCLLLILCHVISLFEGCGSKSKASTTQEDLKAYFKLFTYVLEGGGVMLEAEDNEYAIVFNTAVLEERAVMENDALYLPLDFVYENIDCRFYYDEETDGILYVLPTSVLTIKKSDKTVKVNDTTYTYDAPVMTEISADEGTENYVLADFVSDFSCMDFNVSTDDGCNRIVINTEYETLYSLTTGEKNIIRTGPDETYSILSNVAKGTVCYVCKYYLDPEATEDTTEETETEATTTGYEDYIADGWYLVYTTDGFLGYIQKGSKDTLETVELVSSFEDFEYTHNLLDETVCLGFHQVFNTTANSYLDDVTSGCDSLNVISPTWFSVSDSEGNITTLASTSYVKSAHSKGYEVWPLINDFTTDDDGNYVTYSLYSSKAARETLILSIISAVTGCGADGINVDFEHLNSEIAPDYIQFLFELSVKCRNEGLVLSVDNYVPSSYNLYYNREAQALMCDYIVVMCYDEYYSGGSEAGSNASIGFVTDGVTDTLTEVPGEQLIMAVPFYTRMWIQTPEILSDGTQEIIEDSVYGNYYLTSRTLSLRAAIDILNEHEAIIMWFEEWGQYYGEYSDSQGICYRIWLEEEESMALKLALIGEYDLAGMAAWKLGLEYDEIWDVIAQYVQ